MCTCTLYLDVSHHSSWLHSAGHIDCVSPDVVVRFTSSNNSSENSSFVHTWRDQWGDVNPHADVQAKGCTSVGTDWPIRSMKLLKDCLLRLSRVTFIAKAKSARSARCCQRSINDCSSGCGKAARSFYSGLSQFASQDSIIWCNRTADHYRIPPCGCCSH